MSITKRLIFDVETVGADFDSFDATTQKSLTNWIKKTSNSEAEYNVALEDLKNGLGFSPLTGEIVVIGILDPDKDQGVVYFQAPGQEIGEFTEDNIRFRQMTEAEMLRSFWEGAKNYWEFISYNGRVFDVPFLMTRSAIHGITPTKNLMEGRYLYQQKSCKHVDLQDQLTFYGTTQKKGGLHLWSQAFGIKSPKSGGVNGDDVGRLFKEKKFADIARYNVGDLIATKELYDKWDKYFNI